MARIGITGHARLAGDTAALVADAIAAELRKHEGDKLCGITCLCDGADQIFAQAVIERGGDLAVVLPADDYRERLVDRDDFDRLLGKAAHVSRMPFRHSDRRAFKAASEEVLRQCELLLAVWDGLPSRKLGDTADVVGTARAQGLPVVVLWPAGAHRA
ncbi:hypothetical protein [Phytohabitans houttuyneae]|uniref:Uncharacterized protein n=1 Tax=Phytohabitans houttuyneae TaxID=1076126 RepID=A0A6V8KSJ2_9ACTN|nr:hypothetical protein [Phytohabitans houttuyneae]GFJ84757.1 hypothetical protein Phou_089370 [Phytohabitans houttuyneae]